MECKNEVTQQLVLPVIDCIENCFSDGMEAVIFMGNTLRVKNVHEALCSADFVQDQGDDSTLVLCYLGLDWEKVLGVEPGRRSTIDGEVSFASNVVHFNKDRVVETLQITWACDTIIMLKACGKLDTDHSFIGVIVNAVSELVQLHLLRAEYWAFNSSFSHFKFFNLTIKVIYGTWFYFKHLSF